MSSGIGAASASGHAPAADSWQKLLPNAHPDRLLVNFAVVFACQFARLVWLLLHDAQNVADQKEALREARKVSGEGPVTLTLRRSRVRVNRQNLPDTLESGPDLAAQLRAHGVRTIRFAANVAPAEVLAVARLLASAAADGDGGNAARVSLEALNADSVQFALENGTSSNPSLELSMDASIEVPALPSTVVGERMIGPVREMAPHRGGAPDLSTVVGDQTGMWQHFRSANAPTEAADVLFGRLDAAKSSTDVAQLIEQLHQTAEQAAREGKTHVLADICYGIVHRERSPQHERFRAAYAVAFRRLVRPVVLRAVARLLPRKRDRAADYEAVLARAGDDGADAVIEELAQESTVTDRRVYLEVLPRLQAGVPTLVHMLGDARWFVVRNAADLLGEMKVAEAEGALLPLLQHPDDRVSRSAANALVALNTPTAFRAVAEVMRDESPRARAQAAGAIAHRRDARSATTLRIALDDEPDTDVQFALISALGKVATADAVHRLIRASEPDRKLIGGKSTEFRVAAVEALAEAGTPAALEALLTLERDKDRAVREAATRALQQAAKSDAEARKNAEEAAS